MVLCTSELLRCVQIIIVAVCVRSEAPCTSELLQHFAGGDATQSFTAASHSPAAKDMMQRFLVGHYMVPEQEVVQVSDAGKDSAIL